MREVITRYLAKFDEINLIADAFSEETTEEEAVKTARDIMTDGYIEGFAAVGYMLHDDLERPVDIALMHAALDEVIGEQTTDERVAEHIRNSNISDLKNTIETEFHRVYVLGGDDRAQAINRERILEKFWLTVKDGNVRETHRYLEGISLPLDGEFYTIDGDHARAPGLFSKVENNAHCRCILGYRYI